MEQTTTVELPSGSDDTNRAEAEAQELEFHKTLASKKNEISRFIADYDSVQTQKHDLDYLKTATDVLKDTQTDFSRRADVADANTGYAVARNIQIGPEPTFGPKTVNELSAWMEAEKQESKEGGKLYAAKQELKKKLEEAANKQLDASGRQILRNIATDIVTDEVFTKSKIFGEEKVAFIKYYRKKMNEIADKILTSFVQKKDETGPDATQKQVLGSALCLGENGKAPMYAIRTNTLVQWRNDHDTYGKTLFSGANKGSLGVDAYMMQHLLNSFAEEIRKME